MNDAKEATVGEDVRAAVVEATRADRGCLDQLTDENDLLDTGSPVGPLRRSIGKGNGGQDATATIGSK